MAHAYKMSLYKCFNTWEDFENAVKRHIDLTYQPLIKASSKKVESYNKRCKDPYPTEMVYVYKSFQCSHRGSFKPRGHGIKVTKSQREGCCARIQASLDRKDKTKIVVTIMDERHNHEIGEHLYKKYAQNRCLRGTEKAQALQLCSLDVTNKELRVKVENLTGKRMTLQDVVNLKKRCRRESTPATNPKIKLVYFNIRGRAELIRLILKYAKVPFEDKRVEFSEWPAMKATTPHGHLPYIEMEGGRFAESIPITQFLARKYNLIGKTEVDALETDIVLAQIGDVKNAYVRYKFDLILTDEQKTNLHNQFGKTTLPGFFNPIEKRLSESSSGYLIGGVLTVADLAVFDIMDQAEIEAPGILDNYPKLKELRQKVRDLPSLYGYLKARTPSLM